MDAAKQLEIEWLLYHIRKRMISYAAKQAHSVEVREAFRDLDAAYFARNLAVESVCNAFLRADL